MKYELEVRGLKESDLCRNCIELPEHKDLDMYLDALVEDIKTIVEVKKVIRNKCIIIIELKTNLEKNDLQTKIKPYFSGNILPVKMHLIEW